MYRTLNLDNKYILLVQSTRVTKASIYEYPVVEAIMDLKAITINLKKKIYRMPLSGMNKFTLNHKQIIVHICYCLFSIG